MELQEAIIIFILGIITGVTISKHIGNWVLIRMKGMFKELIEENKTAAIKNPFFKDNEDTGI